jgi:hypothetical protein
MNGPESDENFRHTTPMTHRKFGALRDVHDVRDRIYRAFRTRGQSGARRFSHDVSFCRLAHRFLILLPISGI